MNKRLSLLYFTVILIAGIIVACSGEETAKPETADVVAEPGEDTTTREIGFFELSDKHPFSNQVLNGYKLAKKKNKRVSYFANTYRGTFFLSQNKQEVYAGDNKISAKLRFGLLDSKGNELLPQDYERIGNPGFIADDYMELKQNGKYGLYNYDKKKIITPEYDAIYPSKIMEYVAIGQKGSSFYKIYADGTSKAFADDQPAPNYARLLKTYRYNLESEQFGMWISTEPFDYFEEAYFLSYAYAMVVAPSYLKRLPFIPDISFTGGLAWSEFGEDSTDVSVVDTRKRSESTYSMITSFYTYLSEARGNETHRRFLTTFDTKNTVKASKELFNYDNYMLMNTCSSDVSTPKVKFLNDSVVEVRNFVENEIGGIPYHWYTKYEYYSIAADGKVRSLGNGLFPMTAAIILTKEHFKGCFSRGMDDEEAITSEIYDEDMGSVPINSYTDHLSLADLAYMRNEIYARHGMKFTDPALTAVFKSFKWYKPKRTSVNGLLTPVEKKNLQLIQQLEKELKSNPEAYIHEEQRYMVIAG
jgi:YARHG domain